MNLTVKVGGPLPFAFDILTAVFDNGNRVFAQKTYQTISSSRFLRGISVNEV